MMLIVQYKIFAALRADEIGVCMCIQSKLTYQTYNIIFSLREEMENGFVGYLVHRDFRGETCGFPNENIDFG